MVAHAHSILVLVVLREQGQPSGRKDSFPRIQREGVRLHLKCSVLENVGEGSDGEADGRDAGRNAVRLSERLLRYPAPEGQAQQRQVEAFGGEIVLFAPFPDAGVYRGSAYSETFDVDFHWLVPLSGSSGTAGVPFGAGNALEYHLGSGDFEAAYVQCPWYGIPSLTIVDARCAYLFGTGLENGHGALLPCTGVLLCLYADSVQGDAPSGEVYPYSADVGYVGASVEVERFALQ